MISCEGFDKGCTVSDDRRLDMETKETAKVSDTCISNDMLPHKAPKPQRCLTDCLMGIEEFKQDIIQKIDALSQATIESVKKDINSIPSAEVDNVAVTFERDERLTDMLAGIDSLGKCLIRTSDDTVDCHEHHLDMTTKIIEANTVRPDVMTAKATDKPVYKVVNKSKHTVRLPDEDKPCSVLSSVVLQSGDILLADNNNMRLKLVDCGTFGVKMSLKLEGNPWSVARVNDEEVVVSVVNSDCESWLQFVSTSDGRLLAGRTLTMQHWCIGLVFLKGKLYVTDLRNQVYVYALDGTLLDKLNKDIDCPNPVFSCTQQICMSNDNEHVVVTDRNNGLIKMNTSTYHNSPSILKQSEIWGVATDDQDNTFVTVSNSHKVVVVTPEEKIIELLTASDGLKQPKAICLDTRSNRLYVCCHLDDELLVVGDNDFPLIFYQRAQGNDSGYQ